MADKKIWVRCGDQDDYNGFDNMSDAADYLVRMGVTDTMMRYGEMGAASHDYNGPHNYISLYWGGEDAGDVNRGFNDDELAKLNLAIEGYIDSKPSFVQTDEEEDEGEDDLEDNFSFDDLEADDDY